jgi:hypothetical protein
VKPGGGRGGDEEEEEEEEDDDEEEDDEEGECVGAVYGRGVCVCVGVCGCVWVGGPCIGTEAVRLVYRHL